MNYHTGLNILGKVDPSKTVVTPHEFVFKLKEANAISSIDYERLKAILNNDAIAVPTKDWIEKEKDKQFQNLFRQLWPNTYRSINPPEPKTVPELISELEKKRAISELIAKQDLERHKVSLVQNAFLSNYSNAFTSKANDTLNICINGLSSGAPKIEINSSTPLPSNEAPKPDDEKKYPNLASSYDFNFKTAKYLDTLVNSPYNPDDLTKETELLKSIQESQEKLKLAKKLENTTDLVDDIIEKVKVLQFQMKKKSASFKLMNDIEKLKKEHEENEHKNELMALLENELERRKYCHLNHHHHKATKESINSDSDSSSDNRKRSKSPISILHKPRMSVTFSKNAGKKRKKSAQRLRRSNSYIGPKVDCWNCNCSHDRNVY